MRKLTDSNISLRLHHDKDHEISTHKKNKDRKKSPAYHLLVPRLRFLGVCRFVGRGQRSGLVLVQAARLCEEQAAGPVPVRAASPAAAEETSSQRGVSVSRHQGEVRPSAGRLLGKNMMERVTCILVCGVRLVRQQSDVKMRQTWTFLNMY